MLHSHGALHAPPASTQILPSRSGLRSGYLVAHFSTSSRLRQTQRLPVAASNVFRNVATSDVKAPSLTHLKAADSTVQMVTLDTQKPITLRTAIAVSTVVFSHPDTFRLVRDANVKKGDVLSISRIAGIIASKKTHDLIPLCHNIPLSGTNVDVELVEPGDVTDRPHGALKMTATAKAEWKTGVEMEALTAATMAGLTAYDMCKAVDKGMRMTDVRVVHKEGGRSGTWSEGKQVE